jgi:hypothetical protein
VVVVVAVGKTSTVDLVPCCTAGLLFRNELHHPCDMLAQQDVVVVVVVVACAVDEDACTSTAATGVT